MFTKTIHLALGLMITGCTSVNPTSQDSDNPKERSSDEKIIFDSSRSVAGEWRIEDDAVMGGRSDGAFSISQDGSVIFSGKVSLENNGGFSSVKYRFDPMDVSEYKTVNVRLKGDGKPYQFIVEASTKDRHYYQQEFVTGTEWEIIEIPFSDMVPMRRGNRLNLPVYPGHTLSQTRFLIGNGKEETFRLEIDKIWLEK